jgi:hydrogenase-4 component E
VSASTYASVLSVAVGGVLVCAVSALWFASTRAVLGALATQGVGLGVVALSLGIHAGDPALITTAFVVVALKGLLIPRLLRRLSDNASGRETRPLVNVPASLVVAAGLTFLAFATTRHVVALVVGPTATLVPAGFANLLIGFFVLVARRKPVFQIVGLLLVDNGIALIAFLITAGVPFLIELGVSLDVLLGVVALMLLVNRLKVEHGDLDLDALQELHD